jgi:hypothetical protein
MMSIMVVVVMMSIMVVIMAPCVAPPASLQGRPRVL